MNIREKLIKEFRDKYNPNNVENAYINVKTAANLVIWTDDPDYKDNILPVIIDGKFIELGNTIEEIKPFIDKYNLEVSHVDGESPYYFVAIPNNADIKLAMDVSEDVKSGYKIEKEYVSELIIFFYKDIESYCESMDEEMLKAMFKE